jgi:glycosyltransferase involved in cell wall biosynthesis
VLIAAMLGSKETRRDAEARRLLVRLGLLCAPPAVGIVSGLDAGQVMFCLATAIFWSGLEASLFYRVKISTGCRKIPFVLRLLASLCLDVQFCWFLASDTAAAEVDGKVVGPIATLSVVLPCANESDFVMKTVRAIFEATPREELHEIVIVDDASQPVISQDISLDELEAHRGRIIRHDVAQGLIRSKKDGADSATGDIIVFLDCHVKPIDGWTEDLFQNIRENPKRIVVPTITSLDPDSWQEVGGSAGGRKMCLTWNADFYWCNGYPGQYVPIMSGGLLALSRYWWERTGGYDDEMHAWGGENLDQSLRTWLCGGEIVVAARSRVAHMWRDPNKPKTALHYSIPTEHVLRNRLRAATSWMGPWSKKVRSFPEYDDFREGGPWHIDSLANVEKYQNELQCKDFRWYLNRFQDLYSSIGALPRNVFNLRDSRTGLCLHHELTYGSQQGGKMNLRPCNRDSEAQRWHEANAASGGDGCCSGLKLHDIDICVAAEHKGDVAHAQMCFNFGESDRQYVKLSHGGMLKWNEGSKHEGCIAPRKHDVEGFTGESRTKAALIDGTSCRSRIEEVRSGNHHEFRVVAPGKMCLSLGIGESWADSGRHLLFLPCKDGDEKQVFRYGEKFDDTHFQIKDSAHFCFDAANGDGPIAYQCHPFQDKSAQQSFILKAGEAVVWWRHYEGEEALSSCIDPAPQEKVTFRACADASDGVTAKAGQGFLRHDERGDGSFQLKEQGTESCLAPSSHEAGSQVTIKSCQDEPNLRWSFQGGQLKNVGLDLCVDKGNGHKPILYTCYPAGQNKKQEYILHENGWIESPRSWADNGRVRYLSTCFDTRPVEPIHLIVQPCKDVKEYGTKWEKIWEEVPLETQLFLDGGAMKQGFLGKS